MHTKKCTICKELLPADSFGRYRQNPNGYPYCKACNRRLVRESRARPHKRTYQTKDDKKSLQWILSRQIESLLGVGFESPASCLLSVRLAPISKASDIPEAKLGVLVLKLDPSALETRTAFLFEFQGMFRPWTPEPEHIASQIIDAGYIFDAWPDWKLEPLPSIEGIYWEQLGVLALRTASRVGPMMLPEDKL